MRVKVEIAAAVIATIFLLGSIAASRAQAQNLTVLYSFTSIDDAHPKAGLVMDAAGNLYGTTTGGNGQGTGTLFKLDPSGHETVLQLFEATNRNGALIMDGTGNLYGTNFDGGMFGVGSVYKLDPSGHLTVLYSFTGNPPGFPFTSSDGANPYAGLLMDASGNLYGTTLWGGSFGYGTVFELDTSGHETVLYSFNLNNGDGENPYGGLVMDAVGTLYGTTYTGSAYNYGGTVFKLDTSGTETLTHVFPSNFCDGAFLYAGLTLDAAGNVYGTTFDGGCSTSPGAQAYGTVFKVGASAPHSAGIETILYTFTTSAARPVFSGGDGTFPYAGLVMDTAGNLYGTTSEGGAYGFGTVFKVDTAGTETVLHSFTGSDGANPYAGLIFDAAGSLYGTTYNGGAFGFGTVFKLAPDSIPPSVTVSFAAPPSGQAGFFKAGQTPVLGSVTASDPSNVMAISCSDSLSGLTAGTILGGGTGTASRSLSVSGDGIHNINCAATDGAGNTGAAMGSMNTATIKIDTTPPTVTYSGNPGTYTVDQTVNITCTATDPPPASGLEATTCANINGAAYTFGLGNHPYSATATDNAGNVGNNSTSFTVSVTYNSLINLVNGFVTKAGVAASLVSTLQGAQTAAASGNVKSADNQLSSFIKDASAQSGKSLTAAQATTLVQLATALMI